MKVAELREDFKFEYTDFKLRELGKNDVKIRVKACGVCGSDIHKVAGRVWKYGYPAVMGHEFSGEVVAVGDSVNGVKVGERVVAAPLMPCYDCHYCKQSLYSMCENYKMIGSHFSGGFAEEVIVPKENILKIFDLDYKKAAFVEPLAVVMHCVLGLDIKLGDTVVVLGAGTIGMLAIQAIKNAGAKDIIAVDIDDAKLEKSKTLGATYTVNPKNENVEERIFDLTNKLGADIVVECAGSNITQEMALLLTKKRGLVGYLGIAYKDVLIHEKAFENIFRKELTLKGFWNSYSAPFPGREWEVAIDLIRKNKIDVASLISHEYKLEDTNKAFEMILNREEVYNKVLILP